MNRKAYLLSRSPKLYERLISFYPPSYLTRHRDELLQNFEDLECDMGSKKLFWAFIISDFIKSLFQEYMNYIKNHHWAKFAIAAVVILFAMALWWVIALQKAHSSFANYATFRGCSQITSQSDTSGTCTLSNGQGIKIVKLNSRWYLDGDLPVCGLNLGSICLFNWP